MAAGSFLGVAFGFGAGLGSESEAALGACVGSELGFLRGVSAAGDAGSKEEVIAVSSPNTDILTWHLV